jgi:chromate transporter
VVPAIIERERNMTVPAPVSFYTALTFWLKLGFISFGGPAGQIAIMQRELVDQKHWISQGRFNHALNFCMLLPGPEAQQLATYIGWLMHGTRGGIAAGVLFVLPSLFIFVLLSALYIQYGTVDWVAAIFYGIQCAVAALVLHALWRVGSKTLTTPLKGPICWCIVILSFVALQWFKIGFPWIVLAAAIAGLLGSHFFPSEFTAAARGAAKTTATQEAIIDDSTPTPDHAKFSKLKLIKVLAIGFILMVFPLLLLFWLLGWQHSLTQMAWFFSKAAMVTFGGAYAVLPYVNQAAVEQFSWVTAKQMMDGLALGESTPGPLIMIVAFVGFLGQAQEALRGNAGLATAVTMGSAGACVATWFTFLPSFVFILAGGPVIENTHNKLGFTAPLKAITAAVVGVIATLAWLFFQNIVIAAGGKIDWIALGIIGAAALALFRFKINVMLVILICAFAGYVTRYLLNGA